MDFSPFYGAIAHTTTKKLLRVLMTLVEKHGIKTISVALFHLGHGKKNDTFNNMFLSNLEIHITKINTEEQ